MTSSASASPSSCSPSTPSSSGAEFALLAARRSQIEPRAQEGSRAARTTLRAMENVSLVMAGAQLGITVCSLGLGAIGEPAVAHLLEPVFHAARVPDDLPAPGVVRGGDVGRGLPARRPRRDGAQEHRARRARPRGDGPQPADDGDRHRAAPAHRRLNLAANGVLRLLGIEPKDEVHSSFTREEVAALVEESRGEGLIEADEYDRLAGALGFTEKSVASIV